MPAGHPELEGLIAARFAEFTADIEARIAELFAEAAALSGEPAGRRRRRAAEIRAALDELLVDFRDGFRTLYGTELARVYEAGAAAMATELGMRFTWTAAHREAVEVLVRDLYDPVATRLTGITEDVRRRLRRTIRDASHRVVGAGEAPVAEARRVTRKLANQGVVTVRYGNGAMHSVREWAETAVRTVTATAHNAGTIMQAKQLTATDGTPVLLQVFDGPGCGWTSHRDPQKANGMIVTLSEAEAHPIAHPRCRRAFGARPDLTLDDQALAALAGTPLPPL